MSPNRLTSDNKVRFYLIDALRGIAAVWVVLFHAQLGGRLGALSQALPPWLNLVLLEKGDLGVGIFFVLSGFVIAHSLKTAEVTVDYFKRFSMRRLMRLTPPYYASIIVTLAFAFLATLAKNQPFAPMRAPVTIERVLAHLVYLQELLGFVNLNDVYWTLCLEVQFYLVFCALLGITQWLDRCDVRGSRELVFIPLAGFALLFPLEIFPDTGRPTVFLPLWYSFLIGVFAYWCWKQRFNPILFYSYSAILLTIGLIEQSAFVVLSVATALLLRESARIDGLQRWFKGRALQFLGQISYSLYLTHTPVIGMAIFLGQKVLPPSALTDAICLVASLVVSIMFAAGMWYLTEKPSIAWSQRIRIVDRVPVNHPQRQAIEQNASSFKS